MKLLLIYCSKFGYTPSMRTLENADENVKPEDFENVQAAFIQAEEQDEENMKAVKTKLLKNIKWVCGKNNTRKVILHSFAHLSNSKADPAFTKKLFNDVEERLKNVDYEVHQTPFGYFLDLKIEAPGESLARVFKDF